MTEKPDVLRANCRRYIDALEAGGTDPMVIGALRRLVNSNSHTAARSTQLWHDNQALRVMAYQTSEKHTLRCGCIQCVPF